MFDDPDKLMSIISKFPHSLVHECTLKEVEISLLTRVGGRKQTNLLVE